MSTTRRLSNPSQTVRADGVDYLPPLYKATVQLIDISGVRGVSKQKCGGPWLCGLSTARATPLGTHNGPTITRAEREGEKKNNLIVPLKAE